MTARIDQLDARIATAGAADPRLAVDDEFEPGRLFDGQLGGLGTAEHTVHIMSCPSEELLEVDAIAEEPTSLDVLAERKDSRSFAIQR